MRFHPVLLSIALTAAPAAANAQLANVTGFDALLLAGKTCQGVFDTGRRQVASKGALELRFAVEGGRLTAQQSRLVGKEAHDRAAYALTRGEAVDASGYEALGAVRDLEIRGDTVRYVDPLGARVVLAYKEGRLSGESDPRGGADPRMTRIAFVNLECR